ncbi:hypothetical protein BJX64DRAFT_271958 [Aspergillus heterothallicus]
MDNPRRSSRPFMLTIETSPGSGLCFPLSIFLLFHLHIDHPSPTAQTHIHRVS